MRRFVLRAAVLGLAAVGAVRQAAAATIFSDDFSEANGTVINGKAADVGGAWVENTTTNIAVQNSAVDTSGAARLLFAPFTRPLAAGERLTLTFNSDTVNLFRGGGAYAGLSLYTDYVNGGNTGNERIFVGDTSASSAGWGTEQAGGTPSIQSTDTSLPATVTFTYDYDTGAVALSVNGTLEGTATYNSGLALNALRIANGNGGDIKVNDVTVSAAPVPEPATGSLIVLAGAAALTRRRRRH